eukprot:scaffold1362_cov163-Amphora_coffeaeformis.AAC.23
MNTATGVSGASCRVVPVKPTESYGGAAHSSSCERVRASSTNDDEFRVCSSSSRLCWGTTS